MTPCYSTQVDPTLFVPYPVNILQVATAFLLPPTHAMRQLSPTLEASPPTIDQPSHQ